MTYPIAGPSGGSPRRITSGPVMVLMLIVAAPITAVASSGSEVAMTDCGDSATGTQLAAVPPPGRAQCGAAGSSMTGSAAVSAMHASGSAVAAMQSGTGKLAEVTMPPVPVMGSATRLASLAG